MKVLSQGPEDTVRAGHRLGKLLGPGQTVCLYGDLGSGKTTFVKGVAKALGISPRDIASASFTIVAEYDSSPPLYHIDLYRLDTRADLDSAGIYEYIGGDGVAVVEWAERAEAGALEDAIKVHIKMLSGKRRDIIIEGVDEKDWDNMQKGKARA